AQAIVQRHLIAGKSHHFGAEVSVQAIERRALGGLIGSRFGAHVRSSPKAWPSRGPSARCKPPLSRALRDSGEQPPYRFGEPTVAAGCFPERHQPAVLLPERFRGGCSFGAPSASRGYGWGLFRRRRLADADDTRIPKGVNASRSGAAIPGLGAQFCSG